MLTTEIANPYLDEVVRLSGSDERNQHNRYMVFNYNFMRMDGLDRRADMIRQYGFSVPTPEALALVADHGPIIELGAGCAYWASLLRQMGVDVLAFDKYPPGGRTEEDGGYGWSTSWTDVREGDQSVAADYPDRTLLMIWPSLWEPWAHEALKAYRGATVIYVGEGYQGCTADDAFHEALERDWTETANAAVYQWFGIHDHLYVYQRGGSSNDND